MKKLAVAAVLALSVSAANAAPITVNYSLEAVGHGLTITGTFAGVDMNKDGFLAFAELSAWTNNFDGATLPQLSDIGDFDYNKNIWLANGLQWDQYTENAYMTWHDFNYSVSTDGVNWKTTTFVEVAGGEVPEPTSLALLGIGALALARRRFRK